MIAHHLTSVQDADKILVIAQGKIAEEGTHSELIARNGIYNSMWNEYQLHNFPVLPGFYRGHYRNAHLIRKNYFGGS